MDGGDTLKSMSSLERTVILVWRTEKITDIPALFIINVKTTIDFFFVLFPR